MGKITIAIDGFSSCGKSTMAKDLAKQVGYVYIDSGAMYRAIALYCLQNGFFEKGNFNIEALANDIGKIDVSFRLDGETGLPITFLNGINVENEIRTMDVSSKVSEVSAVSFVRKAIVALLQKMGKEKGIVMDGRDIGTVVFPDAEMKIFVMAQPEIRAKRRLEELWQKGDVNITFEQVLDNLKSRDHMDQTRSESPLVQAKDAIVLDNSFMTIDEQRSWLLDQFTKVIRNNE